MHPAPIEPSRKSALPKETRLQRRRPLDQAEGDFLYSLYLMLFASPLSLHGKYNALETASVDLFPWPITHISRAALEHIVESRVMKGIKRGHVLSRGMRGKAVFEDVQAPMARVNLFEYYYSNDPVTLVTAAENGKNGNGHWSECYPVPEHIFASSSYSVALRKVDAQWCGQVLAAVRTGEPLPA